MKKQKFIFILLVFAALVLVYNDVDAQCAMCKAVPTSEMQDGGSKGAGLNTGILYLLAIPYVLISGFILIFFRKSILQKITEIKLKFGKA